MARVQARNILMAIFGGIEAGEARSASFWDVYQPKCLRGGSIWTGFPHQSAGEQGRWILPGNIPK